MDALKLAYRNTVFSKVVKLKAEGAAGIDQRRIGVNG